MPTLYVLCVYRVPCTSNAISLVVDGTDADVDAHLHPPAHSLAP